MVLALIALILQQTQPPVTPRDVTGTRASTTAILEGRVVADAGEQPLRNVRVTVVATGRDESDPAVTDNEGRFRFTGLAPGNYVVRANKPGYATARFGARRALDPAVPLDLSAGAHVRGIELRLVRGAAISGRAFDDLGEPVVGVALTASQVVRSGTRARLVSVRVAVTDDLGEYRLAGLPPGTYVVSGKVGDLPSAGLFYMTGSGLITGEPTYPRVYYPSAPTLAQARPITVSPGQEVTAADLVFRQVRRPKLTATVTDVSGQPVGGRFVLFAIGEPGGNVARTGRFGAGEGIATEIDPGDWGLQVTGDRAQAFVRLMAGEDDITTNVVLTKGAKLTGRVVFDGATPPSPSSLVIEAAERAIPSPMAGTGTRVNPDGTFALDGLHGQMDIRVRNLPAGWIVRSLTVHGQDVLDAGIDVRGIEQVSDAVLTVSNQRARLAGRVTNGSGAAVAACEVVVFPEDPALAAGERRLRIVRADLDGRIVVDDLPAGAYFAVALMDVDETQWSTPEYLNTLRPIATRVAIAVGDRVDISLTLRRLP